MSATTMGIFAGLLLVSFSKGLSNQRIKNALNTEISHLQIHQPDFVVKDDIRLLISGTDSIENFLSHNELVLGYSSRLRLNSIVSSAETVTNVKVTGINPFQEKTVTDLCKKIIEGDYFEKNVSNQVVIGQKLATKLKVKLLSKIVLQIQDLQGNISPAAFRIAGIYKTSNSNFDEFNVFVQKKELGKLMLAEANTSHEIAIFLKDYHMAKKVQTLLASWLPGLEVSTWKELDVMLSYLNDSMDQYLSFVMVVILLALVFGIVNTMMMAILERIKELGMLMAIGMNKSRIIRMILYETVLLTLTGALAGITIGMAVVHYYGIHGIDLSLWGKGMEQFGFASTVYTTIEVSYVAEVVVLVILTGILAAIFPVLKAIQLKPVQALKTDN
jgi:ABC-type lipoprotein release transport system permease subunit